MRRRTVMKGASWAAPAIVIAPAAPAAALSACDPTTLQWTNTKKEQTTIPLTGSGMAASASITLNGKTLDDHRQNPGRQNDYTNGVITSFTAIPGTWLALGTCGINSAGETVVITFPKPMSEVSFTIHDIDAMRLRDFPVDTSYIDVVTVSVDGAKIQAQAKDPAFVAVTGSGTSTVEARPAVEPEWDREAVSEISAETSTRGDVTYTVSGESVTSLTITYTNPIPSGKGNICRNNQQVFLSAVTVTPARC
ncbi:hypothetical protein [Actinomyces faecalis]|nr:hypothetical protein [Actinomyces faecalis]